MVAERPWYIPRKCNASFLLSGVCGCTLRLRCAARFVLRIIEVIVLVIGVVRVRCARAITALAEHQVIGTEQGAEAVSSDGELLSEVLLAQEE